MGRARRRAGHVARRRGARGRLARVPGRPLVPGAGRAGRRRPRRPECGGAGPGPVAVGDGEPGAAPDGDPAAAAGHGRGACRAAPVPTEGAPSGGAPDPLAALDETLADAGIATDFAAERAWLDAHAPAPGPTVVCHGDLQPAAMRLEGDDPSTALLVNWSSALVAEAEYDVALTNLMFWSVPYLADGMGQRKMLKTVREVIIDGYRAAYEGADGTAPLEPDRLRLLGRVPRAALVGGDGRGRAAGRPGRPVGPGRARPAPRSVPQGPRPPLHAGSAGRDAGGRTPHRCGPRRVPAAIGGRGGGLRAGAPAAPLGDPGARAHRRAGRRSSTGSSPATGVTVDEATCRAASRHARRHGLDVLDLVPADLPVEPLLALAWRIVPRPVPGRPAGHRATPPTTRCS